MRRFAGFRTFGWLCLTLALFAMFQLSACQWLFHGGGGGTGATSSIGGFSSTGGTAGAGGANATGGNQATGGQSVAIVWPDCPQGAQARKHDPAQLKRWKSLLGPKLDRRSGAKLAFPRMLSLIASVLWPDNDPNPKDQTVGSCTGCGMAQILSTGPFKLKLTTADAENKACGARPGCGIYSHATQLDESIIKGVWPPTDTGSTGYYACRSAVDLGFALDCLATMNTVEDGIATLERQPIGIAMNWRSNTYTPACDGHLDLTGNVDGAHFMGLVGPRIVLLSDGSVDENKSRVYGRNSWGNQWGACIGKACGYWYVTITELRAIVDDGGQFDGPKLTP